MEKRWVVKAAANADQVKHLADAINVNHKLAGLLVQRGITTFEEAKTFFRPSLNDLHDPFLMKDMDKAIARLEKAIDDKERILVYGDYDVDGTTAVSLVYSSLTPLHPHLEYYIPDRYTEGYGVSYKGIDYAAAEGYTLIIALDCGIKAVEKVAYATEKGVDFIICDHHRPGDEVPQAIAVLDPKQDDCSYPYDELSGCGIGFKLMQALYAHKGLPFEQLLPCLDLLAVSIAADIVPITGENRVLAYYGVKRINETPRQGIKAILTLATVKKELSITDLVFIIGPRINAAGRIESGKKAVELLVSNNEEAAAVSSKLIDEDNIERKQLDKSITLEALGMLAEDNNAGAKTTVLFQEHWHKGVIGIVASRLIEAYYRPTIVLTESGGKATGSARSVKGFDIYNAIDQCSDLLEQFGGHKYAAGLTMSLDKVTAFQQKFEAVVASTITEQQLVPEIEIDMELELQEITSKFYKILKQLGPFGPQNMKPIFISRNVMDTGWGRIVGENHVKLTIASPHDLSIKFGAIGFGLGAHFNRIMSKDPFDIVYTIEENEWDGKVSLQLNLKDIRFHD